MAIRFIGDSFLGKVVGEWIQARGRDTAKPCFIGVTKGWLRRDARRKRRLRAIG
ncbi:hypothetical protein [Pelomonas aquatica]|jgi:hypothetical protein|uniref:hypothetical protein n=1 Tax=Pelomonas aquatica TaxID=431058 RepID=UPI00227C0995|nr:hypothetical protein [Pelomonas aquatica]MCY4755795.1 hypothetical protein [Pelomonas aquatica]